MRVPLRQLPSDVAIEEQGVGGVRSCSDRAASLFLHRVGLLRGSSPCRIGFLPLVRVPRLALFDRRNG